MSAPKRKRLTDESEWRPPEPEGFLTEEELERAEELGMTESGVPTGASYVPSANERSSHWKTPPSGSAASTERTTSMSIIDPSELGLGTIPEPMCMPDGYEAHLRVISVRRDTNKNGGAYLQPLFEILGEPQAKDFTHYLGIPNRETMTNKAFQRAGFELQNFMQACGLGFDTAFDPVEEWPGCECWAILRVTEDDKYGRQNAIAKFIMPR